MGQEIEIEQAFSDEGMEGLCDILEELPPPSLSRNDPCLCGSGKKYKKCCLTKNKTTEISVPFTNEDFPLETLSQLIEAGLIKVEIPFEVLADQYPSLLEDWYPGYPAMLRKMTPEDPMRLAGYITNGTVSFKDIPEMGTIALKAGANSPPDGEYQVWVTMDKGSWVIHVVMETNCTSAL
jgi:hypothetical protein